MNLDETHRDLDFELKKAELEKLEAEIDEVKFKASRTYRRNELIKGYGGIASALAGLAAVVTVIWTIWQGINQIELQREEKRDIRVEKAIRELNSDNTKLRLFAASALRLLLNDRHERRRSEILSAVSYALATEKEVIVRDSMISLLASLQYGGADNNEFEKMLSELAGLSRSLVLKEQLWVNHKQYFSKLSDGSAESRAQSIAEAINILVKNDIRVGDLTGIYCAYCDFRGLDLEGLDFSESILHGADFSESTLINASFNHVVIERAKFINSDLRNSSFSDERRYDKWAGSFAHRRLDKSGGSYAGPDFSCANLSNSNFTEFPIFILSSDDYDPLPFMNKIPPKFTRANLSNVDFKKANVLVFASNDLPNIKEYVLGNAGGYGHIDRPLRAVEFDEKTTLSEEHYHKFGLALIGIKKAFLESSWREAKLPKGISIILTNLDSNELFTEGKYDDSDFETMDESLGSACVSSTKN